MVGFRGSKDRIGSHTYRFLCGLEISARCSVNQFQHEVSGFAILYPHSLNIICAPICKFGLSSYSTVGRFRLRKIYLRKLSGLFNWAWGCRVRIILILSTDLKKKHIDFIGTKMARNITVVLRVRICVKAQLRQYSIRDSYNRCESDVKSKKR